MGQGPLYCDRVQETATGSLQDGVGGIKNFTKNQLITGCRGFGKSHQ